MPKKRALLYFVKYPEPGQVKKRLAESIGPKRAAEEYRRLAESNYNKLLALTDSAIDMVVMFAPYEKSIQMEEWLPGACHYVVQQGADLGARLQAAFLNAFEADFEQAVAFGSDTMIGDLRPVEQAFLVLEKNDAVIGPAFDGGYYLLGLSKRPKRVFHEIDWSTKSVFETTKLRLDSDGFSYEVLEALQDLDDINDLTPRSNEI